MPSARPVAAQPRAGDPLDAAPARGRDDEALLAAVAAVQAGDAGRFEEIYRGCFPSVHALVRTMLRDAHEAEDVVQETFLAALRALPRYRPVAGVPFIAWLLRIARNAALMRLRRAGRVAVIDPTALTQRRDAADAAAAVDAELGDRHPLLGAELARMPPRQRQVLVLRCILDLTSAETAAVLEMTPAAVRQVQRRALTTLRQRLQARGAAPAAERG